MVDCGDPGNPYGGYRHIATNTKYQSTVTYTCQPQHHLEGENSQVCQADGTWSGSKPVCLRKFVKVAWHSIFLGIPSIFGPLSNVLSLAPKDAFRIYPQHDQHVDNEFFVEGLSWCFLKAGVCVCVCVGGGRTRISALTCKSTEFRLWGRLWKDGQNSMGKKDDCWFKQQNHIEKKGRRKDSEIRSK